MVTRVIVLFVALLAPVAASNRIPDVAGQAARPLPKTDSHPDLQGVWQTLNTAAWDVRDHPGQLFPGLPARFAEPAGQGVVDGHDIPYQPWALQQQKENYANRAAADPEAKCYLPGVPRITYMPYPFQIFQYPDRVVILYEYLHTTREIFTDGSTHPTLAVDFWMGDSRGRWEGNTLIVDTTNFTAKSQFRGTGDRLHLVERFTRTGPEAILYEFTVDDPASFTRSWSARIPMIRSAGPMIENACHEGNYGLRFLLGIARWEEQKAADAVR